MRPLEPGFCTASGCEVAPAPRGGKRSLCCCRCAALPQKTANDLYGTDLAIALLDDRDAR